MNVLLLTVFVSLGLVVVALLGFGFMHHQRDLEHNDRLSLLPLDDDADAPLSSPMQTPATNAAKKEPTR